MGRLKEKNYALNPKLGNRLLYIYSTAKNK